MTDTLTEKLARRLCEARGIDPDETGTVVFNDPDGNPNWMRFQTAAREFLTALQFAKEEGLLGHAPNPKEQS